MADFESAVRQALRTAVPTDLEAEPSSLIDGAARYARGARLSRAVGGATAAVALAALVAATSWLVLDRPREEPAKPAPSQVTTRLCRDLAPTAPPRTAAEVARGVAAGGMTAALCPTAGAEGEGWDLPGAPLTLERWVAYLRRGLTADGTGACPVGAPAGRPFTVVIERLDGARTAYRSNDLACGGREAVGRYLAALAYQRADQDAAAVSGYTLQCSPPKDLTSRLDSPRAPLESHHSSALLCLYPQYDTGSPGRLVARDYRAVRLDARQVASVESDLVDVARTGGQGSACEGSRWQLALRLASPGSHGPDGDLVELVGNCPAGLRLNGYAQWWQPSAQTRDLLTALVPAD